uniref:Secreted protein n=1 Tax=Poecilia latipinna TaxID=48699 RepID=A0A3B3UQJ1_9TELE
MRLSVVQGWFVLFAVLLWECYANSLSAVPFLSQTVKSRSYVDMIDVFCAMLQWNRVTAGSWIQFQKPSPLLPCSLTSMVPPAWRCWLAARRGRLGSPGLHTWCARLMAVFLQLKDKKPLNQLNLCNEKRCYISPTAEETGRNTLPPELPAFFSLAALAEVAAMENVHRLVVSSPLAP